MSHLNDPYRLPKNVVPSRYEVSLEPNLDEATFSGSVRISCLANSAEEVVLNSKQLDIAAVAVNGTSASWALDPETERLVIDVAVSGDVIIEISFNGTLNDRLRGFYRSRFEDADGKQRVIATTQMQSTDCRAAFPCFDEPDFKAVFSITLIAPSDMLAISNGIEISRRDLGNGRHEVHFSDTMPMSTYLVAFIVGPLEVTEAKVVNGVPVRVVHVPGKADLAQFGLEAGAYCLNWFHEYYGIPYPAEKVDLVALPDFAAGAMENVGCVTFREVLLLLDLNTATTVDKLNVAEVVAHELAHMWFGDLVTMKWWNGIWLNEAFATFMGVAACNDFLPELQRWTTFGLDRAFAYEVDSLESSRPIEFEVRSPEDSEGMFDVLTYEKGGSLLRMLEMYLGPERFRAGVSHYLKRHAYGNTETNDLWDALEDVVNNDGGEAVPVRRLMDSWIWQKGYPLISAGIVGNDLVLHQERFSYTGSDASLWVVPMHISINGEITKVIFDKREMRLALSDPSATILVNAGGSGNYRVDYSADLLTRLSGPTLSAMTTLERYVLVDDAWSAVKAGRMSARSFLDFTTMFRDELDLPVWQAITSGLRMIARIAPESEAPSVAAFIRELTAPMRTRLGWDPSPGETGLMRQLRGLLVNLAGTLGEDSEVITRCNDLWAASRTEHVDPELMTAVIEVICAHGNKSVFEEVQGRYESAATPQDAIRYLYALGMFPDRAIAQRAADFAFSEQVRAQDAPYFLRILLENRHVGAIGWEAISKNWDKANERFPINSIIRMVNGIRMLLEPELVAQTQAFFAEHEIPQAGLMLPQTLEIQRVNAALRERTRANW